MAALATNADALNAHMAANSYIEGATPTMKDISVFKAICPVPTLPHAARWYKHIASFSESKIASLPGVFENIAAQTKDAHKGGAAAPAPAPAAEGKKGKEKKGTPSPEEIERLKAEKAAEKAAKGAKKEEPKKEEKKPKEEKKDDKKDEKPAPSAKDIEKARQKIIKEGGKKGVEIEGASELGGLDFFCTTVELPEGNIELLELSMLAMNAEPDPEAEDRKGCSGLVGKMIFSAGVEQLAMVAYVPDKEYNKSADKVDAQTWMEDVCKAVDGTITTKSMKVVSLIPDKRTGALETDGKIVATNGKTTGSIVCAVVKSNPEKGKFALKDKDAAMAAAFGFLRAKGAFPEDDGDDSDEMVFGDDDNLDDYM
jgi:hypothetical protein